MTEKKVQGERRLEIEACLVRIMKARRQLGHNELQIEVCFPVRSVGGWNDRGSQDLLGKSSAMSLDTALA